MNNRRYPQPGFSLARLVRDALALASAASMLLPAVAVASGPSCTAEEGQAFIDQGQLTQAVHEFTCVIDNDPVGIDGYRGRAEARLLQGRFSDAYRDYNTGITALVVPVQPDAFDAIYAGYATRLSDDPDSIPALTGASFARWVNFDYAQAIPVLNELLAVKPNDLYGTLFRGSSRLLHGKTTAKGVADLEKAIQLAPASPDVRYIVADAYTYGLADPERAAAEATLALEGGLDTPRVHAILAASYTAFGDLLAAAQHIEQHIDAVTTELITTAALASGDAFELDVVPGRTYAIPIMVTAGASITVTTSSPDFWDSIAVLRAPDGSPVVGSDDDSAYFAAIDFAAPLAGTYMLHVTSFESVSTGELVVERS
jgi:tetratricopeptide (TPR) repeat protein